MNEGVKIVCDKILEHPEVTDASADIDITIRRWMTMADFIIENDYNTFDQSDVDAVKDTIRLARQKYFTGVVLEHVVWETDPKSNQYSYPLVPRSKKILLQEQKQLEEQAKQRMEMAKYEEQYRLRGGPHPSSAYGIGSNITGGLF